MDTIQLPMDADLLMELTTRQWKQDSKGEAGNRIKAGLQEAGLQEPRQGGRTYHLLLHPATTSD
jgi:phage terminase large subunit